MSDVPAPTVLLTGFEPFAGADSNSSWDAVATVAKRWSPPVVLVAACIPVDFETSLDDLIATHSPDVVIAVGLANGRRAITPERVAINLKDARIPDNSGAQPLDEPVVPDGPAAYFTGLPVKAMVARMLAAGVPAELSQTAGTFVCNALMYRLMHSVARGGESAGRDIRAGFIHVPCSPNLAAGTDQPFLTVETIARGLEIAIHATLELDADAKVVGGAEG